jgi:hypothetical protein
MKFATYGTHLKPLQKLITIGGQTSAQDQSAGKALDLAGRSASRVTTPEATPEYREALPSLD